MSWALQMAALLNLSSSFHFVQLFCTTTMLLAVEPFPSDFTGGLPFLGLRFLDLENGDPGQTFG